MRKLSFSVEQIRTFIAVAESPNLSRAAQKLSLTQGAVTQQIRHLEHSLGLQLVERTRRGVRLTPGGAEVAAACRVASRDLEAIDETAKLHRAVEIGNLRLGASPTCADHYITPLLLDFTKRWPRVEVRVLTASTPSISELVASASLDCGLIEGPTDEENLERRPLYKDAMVVVVKSSHALAKTRKRVEAEVADHVYVAREPTSATERIAREILGSMYGRSSRVEFTHLDAVRAAVIGGLGYAVLPEVAIRAQLASGELVRLDIPPRIRTITAIRRTATKLPVVEAFWSVLPRLSD